jgi:hypothetical protein
MLWLYRERDVIWNELRLLFFIEGWQHSPGVGPRMAQEARNNINWLCHEYASFKGLPSFEAWNVDYIHTVLHRHPERQRKPK